MKYLFTTIITLLLSSVHVIADGAKSKVPLADPYVLLDGDTYYAYGTHSADGIEVWTSDDLYVWEYKGLALNKANTTETQWFWAPEVYYKNNKYYMYYSANEHLYVATSDSPLGPFRQVGNCIWMCELEDDYMTPIDGTLKKCINVSLPWENLLGRVCEGPNMVKFENKYYLTYSANDYNSQSYAVGCATTSSLSNPTWGKYTTPIS